MCLLTSPVDPRGADPGVIGVGPHDLVKDLRLLHPVVNLVLLHSPKGEQAVGFEDGGPPVPPTGDSEVTFTLLNTAKVKALTILRRRGE